MVWAYRVRHHRIDAPIGQRLDVAERLVSPVRERQIGDRLGRVVDVDADHRGPALRGVGARLRRARPRYR